METLIPLLIVAIIIGAILGGKSFGETVRKGCGFLIMLLIIALVIAVFSIILTNSEKDTENQEVISTADNSAYFIVKKDCQTYIKPNIESDVTGSLEIGKSFFVEDIHKFNYFYKVIDENKNKTYARKECFKKK